MSFCLEPGLSSAHLRGAEMRRSASGVSRVLHEGVVSTSAVSRVVGFGDHEGRLLLQRSASAAFVYGRETCPYCNRLLCRVVGIWPP